MHTYLDDPKNFPHSLDLKKGMLNFIELDQDRLRTLPFLDYRFIGANPRLDGLSVAAIYETLSETPKEDRHGKLNFLFHNSFCCSTLLARCLDYRGRNLSLKEPMVLLGLAQYKQAINLKTLEDPKWRPLMNLVLSLLARPHNNNERTLIKPSNAANNLAPEVFESPYVGNVLLLYSTLERYLISIVDGGESRRETVNGLLPVFLFDYAHDLPMPVHEMTFLPPLKRAAILWGLQVRGFLKLLRTARGARLAALNTDTFMTCPVETLQRVSQFYKFDLSLDEARAITQSPTFLTHSKDPGRPYSKDIWQRRRDAIMKTSGAVIEEAIEFTRDLGFPVNENLPGGLMEKP